MSATSDFFSTAASMNGAVMIAVAVEWRQFVSAARGQWNQEQARGLAAITSVLAVISILLSLTALSWGGLKDGIAIAVWIFTVLAFVAGLLFFIPAAAAFFNGLLGNSASQSANNNPPGNP